MAPRLLLCLCVAVASAACTPGFVSVRPSEPIGVAAIGGTQSDGYMSSLRLTW